MRANATRRKKPELSLHQKRIRFLTGLSIIVGFLITAAFFWLVNAASFAMR